MFLDPCSKYILSYSSHAFIVGRAERNQLMIMFIKNIYNKNSKLLACNLGCNLACNLACNLTQKRD